MNQLRTITYVTVALILADAATTAIGLAMGAVELNPLFTSSPWAAVVANVAVALSIIVVMAKWGLRLERAGLADHVMAVLAIVATIKAVATLNNLIVLVGVREWVFSIPLTTMYVIMAIGVVGIATLTIDAVRRVRVK